MRDIDLLLQCSMCEQKTDVPKNLPCGFTICSKCERNLYSGIEQTFNCQQCKEAHNKPNTGLPKSISLARLLEIQPKPMKFYQDCEHTLNALEQVLGKCQQLLAEDFQTRLKANLEYTQNDLMLENANEIIQKLNEFKPSIDRICTSCMNMKSKLNGNASDADLSLINTNISTINVELDQKLVIFNYLLLRSTLYQ